MSPDPTPNEPMQEGRPPRVSERLVAVLLLEGMATAIGLVTPLTPSRTGSRWSPAELVITDPSYLEKAAASFVVVNALLLVLGLAAWIAFRLSGSEEGG